MYPPDLLSKCRSRPLANRAFQNKTKNPPLWGGGGAQRAQSAEHVSLDLVVMSSSPTPGEFT